MQTIYKYPIPVDDVFTLQLPKSAQLLTIQIQHDKPFIWVWLDSEAAKEKRIFEVYGTGHSMSNALKKYVGTFQIFSGDLVFHLFELL